jgi:hypothetical protein
MSKSSACLSIAILVLFSVFHAYAATGEPGEGYDENTEITIKGTISEVAKGTRGPVVLRLSHGGRYYSVVTAPPWYLKRNDINFPAGLEVEVTGSKYFGEDGTLYVIGRRIREVKTGREILLRDTRCRPMWHGMRNR